MQALLSVLQYILSSKIKPLQNYRYHMRGKVVDISKTSEKS